ncbi:hypothetical protein LPB248_06655 [Flavobacterium sp. LPB0248]|uniref:hypothetical protein n=1 Tax=Flavobacterium sp. LPB0248 TaxID=2614441 RepID=UPI0015A5910A|nr:hypothetical protein [Flavobacterium sp. LPB0248]QLC65969.1 hypothetical protein LPB248_06655 [Flavobacterium sp. LPB0248]
MKIVRPLYIIILTAILLINCKYEHKIEINRHLQPPIKASIQLNKGGYLVGETIKCRVSLENQSNANISIEDLELEIKNISNGSGLVTNRLQGIKTQWKSHEIKDVNLTIAIPKEFPEGVYGIYFTQKEKGYVLDKTYETFFRIINKNELTVFDIETDTVQGVPVFKLDGGMSAEYVVEKSAENLTSGISHSWKVNAPGSGPNHVLATPDFLEKSVNKTVGFYNKAFGEYVKIETVIISPGFPSIPYISNALKAPVLPLHFLVSVNTVKEIQTILKTANDKGIASYATLSHDPSVPYAVSWIKLLDLPEAYKKFIVQHQVKQVVVLGATGTSGGETKAKQLFYDNTINGEYANRSIYIMYPGTSEDDVKTLNNKIVDLRDFKQQNNFIQIADWESGINQKQLSNFSKSVKSINGSIASSSITAEDLGRLYYLGTYSTLALMYKNKDAFKGVNGVVFNPYLISHPAIELKKGFVPLLYWQLVGANYTVYNLEQDVFKAIKHFYPVTNVKSLKLWLNSTRNFGAKWSANNLKEELNKKGYSNFIVNNYDIDEVWDASDNVDSVSELLFRDVNSTYGFENLKKWNDSLKPLTIEDIKVLSEVFGGFQVETR